jgi:hypothetical protein
VVEVNPAATELPTRATIALQGPAGRVLPELCTALGTPGG